MNLNGVDCFWNEENSICLVKICENGPSTAQSHLECPAILPSCQKGGCRKKECFDYNYAIDYLYLKTRGVQPMDINVLQERLVRTQIYLMDVRLNINLNPCIWIDEKCYAKTCQTAQISLTKNEECNSYLPFCTVKKEGGCTRKQSCKDYQIKEACNTNSENHECLWDDYLNKRFSYQCYDFCGDGIFSSKDEQR